VVDEHPRRRVDSRRSRRIGAIDRLADLGHAMVDATALRLGGRRCNPRGECGDEYERCDHTGAGPTPCGSLPSHAGPLSRSQQYRIGLRLMAGLIEAIDIKRKMFFEYENAPYHCLDVEISRPTARGGQTLVRLKMRNLLTRAVFDRTFKAGEKFSEPDLVQITASYMYADNDGFHFMDQESYETLTLSGDVLGDDRKLLVDNVNVQIHKYNGNPIGLQLPPHVELKVTYTEPGVRGDTASG